MKRTARNATRGFVFFGSLLMVLLLLPRVAAAQGAPLTGQDNSFIAQSTSCPGWGEDVEMAPSSTIEEYAFGASKQILTNQWDWLDNGVTSTYYYDYYQSELKTTSSTTTLVDMWILDQSGTNAYYYSGQSISYYIGTAGGRAYSMIYANGNGLAYQVQWEIYNPSGQLVLNTYDPWPQTY